MFTLSVLKPLKDDVLTNISVEKVLIPDGTTSRPTYQTTLKVISLGSQATISYSTHRRVTKETIEQLQKNMQDRLTVRLDCDKVILLVKHLLEG